DLQQAADAHGKEGHTAVLTLEDVQKRREKINEEIKTLEKLPPLKKVLRYRTPVSRPVHSEEWHFECHEGRGTFRDISTTLDAIKRQLHDKGDQLKTQWSVRDVTEPVGSFRLHYVIERQRDVMDSTFNVGPEAHANFGYGLSEWIVEPVSPLRGETLQQTMA